MTVYEYVGCFFDYEELTEKVAALRKNPLECPKKKPHVTFEYGPDSVDTALFGEEILVTIVGYGNDGENEGVLVTISSENDRIMDMASKIPVPHITLAVSPVGKAVNTKFLQFTPVDPICIVGHYDGHIDE